MNIIYHLLDEQYVIKLFKKEVLPKYQDFIGIQKINIRSHKSNIWETTYHVVIEYKTFFITKENKIKALSIFCSAHSDEPRINVYKALEFLWKNNFCSGYCTIPHPLFYSDYFKATFYRGVQGNNLYHYIRRKDLDEIKNLIPKAAQWFAKLHRLPTENAINFNKENSRIKTVIPGVKHILYDIEKQYPQHYSFYKKAYEIFIKNEDNFLQSTDQGWYVHGDAHPENIIKMGKKKLAVIDFTDICLSDFARDLGTFLQQLEYMILRKIDNKKFAREMNELFLDNYLDNAKMELDKSLKQRINNYYNWTAIRTATFFLIKYKSEPERAIPLIDKVKKDLNI